MTSGETAAENVSLIPSSSVKGGELHVSVSSLRFPTPKDSKSTPSFVLLEACGKKAQTGNPLPQQQIDGTNVVFAASDDLVIQKSKLQKFHTYKTLAVTVVYPQQNHNLQAIVDMTSLLVNHDTKLILNLGPTSSNNKIVPGEAAGTTCPKYPTLELQVQLLGPLRWEIKTALAISHYWFSMVDKVEAKCQGTVSNMPASTALPALLAAVVLTPILTVVLVVLLPFFFPAVAVFVTGAVSCSLAFLAMLASTPRARNYLGPYIQPIYQTSMGQAILYPIGPRPTPVTFLEGIVPQGKSGRLILSIIIDIIGCASIFVPFVGAAFDVVVWAPIQTMLIMAMYESTSPKLKWLSLAEEWLPFTDIIPSATIGWVAQFGITGQKSQESKKKD